VNLMMLLEMAASGSPDRIAVQNGADRLSYEELLRAAGCAAAEARAFGCERFAMLDVSSLALPIGLFGSAWAGVPFVPLSYRLTGEEIERLASQIVPAYLVTEEVRVEALSRLPQTRVVSREAFLARAREGTGSDASWPMVSYILGSVEFGSASEDDAALVSVPPYHVAGIAAIVSSVYAGRRIVQLPAFEAKAWIELARSERITHAFVVPTMLARIVDALDAAEDAGLPHLRALSYGGGKMPQPVIERAMRLFPDTDFTNAYGLTETSSTIAILGPEDHRAAAASDDVAIRRRLTSVGRPLPSLEVEIRDTAGRPLPPGERGEIHVRGEQVSGEYLGRGSTVDEEGWFPTRDAGSIDAEGYLFLEGRADDVIVRGGENLSPGEIEDVLLEHEAVSDSAVVGIPDEQWGEAVAAVVVLHHGRRASVEELRDWVRTRLRSSRTPERIEFRDELPYNETGKLLRRQIRAELSG
jgi:acyl-CoA synthetase (AMP-forming)/AMP-acid ligase II